MATYLWAVIISKFFVCSMKISPWSERGLSSVTRLWIRSLKLIFCIHSIAKTLTPWKHKLWTMRPNGPSMLWVYFFFQQFFIAKNKNSKLLIIMMEMRLLFKHYPQIRRVSSFTVYAFKVSTFLQLSVYDITVAMMLAWILIQKTVCY